MSEKKMVSRNVAIVLGLACIVLAAGLGVVAYSATSLRDQLNELNASYQSYQSTHSYNNSQYNILSDIANDLNLKLYLAEYTDWVYNQTVSQPPNSFTVWTFSAEYAGFVVISVLSSNETATLCNLAYSIDNVNFNQTQVVQTLVGVPNSATFPILPYEFISVGVGNSNLLNGATETVTVTYWY
jgi:hypothetical protein